MEKLTTLQQVSADQVRTFIDDGVVCLKGLFRDWVAPLRTTVDDLMKKEAKETSGDKDSLPGFFRKSFTWLDDQVIRQLATSPQIGKIGAQLLESVTVRLYCDQIFVKNPGSEAPSPWHHDAPYYPLEGTKLLSIWIALDRTDLSNGAVEYVRRSHHWGADFRPAKFAGGLYDGTQQIIPDIDNHRDEYEIVSFKLYPGDCVVHHGHTVHGAPGNADAKRNRRAVIIRLVGDDIRYRPDPTVPHVLPRDPGIHVGEPLASSLFPTVWPTAPGGR